VRGNTIERILGNIKFLPQILLPRPMTSIFQIIINVKKQEHQAFNEVQVRGVFLEGLAVESDGRDQVQLLEVTDGVVNVQYELQVLEDYVVVVQPDFVLF
jgi:hypothetical protein